MGQTIARGYCRVSPPGQSELGLRGQRRAIEAFARTQDYHLAEVVTEIVSGKLTPLERPELSGLLSRLNRGEVLIVARLDRLGRAIWVLPWLAAMEAQQIQVLSAAGDHDDGTAIGALRSGVASAVSLYERRIISERTKSRLQENRARGLRVGSVPYGYHSAGGWLYRDAAEQRVVRIVKAWRKAGCSLSEICHGLECEGHRPRSGGRWYTEQIARMLAAQPLPTAQHQPAEDDSAGDDPGPG